MADARVLRQLDVLAQYGDVVTVGYGPSPERASAHLEIPVEQASLPQTPAGVMRLILRRFRAVELTAPAVRTARELIGNRDFDLVVANEARALPLAFAVANGAPVWGDMHEWAPGERTHVLSWRLLVAPFMRNVCRVYLRKCGAVSTVNRSIADLYEREFGVTTAVVRNALALQDLVPCGVKEDRIRLVHSGAAVPGRNIETLIDAALLAGERFTLDLYLVPARDGGRYLRELRARSRGSERITFHAAVDPSALPATLNAYDVGVFSLPPRTINHRYMLPNKFFDFVQARVAIVFGTSFETDRLITDHSLGLIARDFHAETLAEVLRGLNAESVRRFKASVHAAAQLLSSEQDEAAQRSIIEGLLSSTGEAR